VRKTPERHREDSAREIAQATARQLWALRQATRVLFGCLYSFLLAERDDLATGRYVNDPHYVVVEVVNREEDEETDDEYDKEDPDWWKE